MLVMMQDMTTAQNLGGTTGMAGRMFEALWPGSRDSMSDLASFDDGQAGEDEVDDEEDIQRDKLRDDDDPSGVIGTISDKVQQCQDSFPQKERSLDQLTQPG
jgi:hypothetical protein